MFKRIITQMFKKISFVKKVETDINAVTPVFPKLPQHKESYYHALQQIFRKVYRASFRICRRCGTKPQKPILATNEPFYQEPEYSDFPDDLLKEEFSDDFPDSEMIPLDKNSIMS